MPKRFAGKTADELDIKKNNPEYDFDNSSPGELSLKKKRPPSRIVKPAFEIFAKLQRNIDADNLEEFNKHLNALETTVDPLIGEDSLLQQAIKKLQTKNNNSIVEALLKKGADPNLLNINFETALDTFIQTIKPLDAPEQVSQQRFNDFYTRFFNILSLLIEKDARCFIKRVVAEGKSSEPPLHSLVGNSNITLTLGGESIVHKFVSDYLATLDADVARDVVNAQDSCHGYTLLHVAARYSTAGMVECLLTYGADPKTTNTDGDIPIALAQLNQNQHEIEKVLTEVNKVEEEIVEEAGAGPEAPLVQPSEEKGVGSEGEQSCCTFC